MRNNIQPMKNLLDAQSRTLKQNTYKKDQIKTYYMFCGYVKFSSCFS